MQRNNCILRDISVARYPLKKRSRQTANLFHVAWQGNFESWIQDPLHVRPIAHAIWDPHLGSVNIGYFGVYQWWYTICLCSNGDLYTGTLLLLFLSIIS
ncbi:hypothetical protein AAZX31_02G163600 [Glycine max]